MKKDFFIYFNFLCLVTFFLICLPLKGYQIQSGITKGCHEKFTTEAFDEIKKLLSIEARLPNDKIWEKVYKLIVPDSSYGQDRTQLELFLLFSLVLGTRAPDTDGNTVFSLRHLRAGKSFGDEHLHFIRSTNDNYEEGNATVIASSRQILTSIIEEAIKVNFDNSIEYVPMALDFYESIDVPVWIPAFLVGFAVHIVQDSFSHTIRTEQSEFKEIAHVANFIDAMSNDYNENRDGLAHSKYTDRCDVKELEPIYNAVNEATKDFFIAAFNALENKDIKPIEAFKDTWIIPAAGCTLENNLCNNEKWINIMRKDISKPLVSCTAAPRFNFFKSIFRLLF